MLSHQSNISLEIRVCLAAQGLVLGRLRDLVWHNRLNVFGGGHLKRPIFRSPAAVFFP